MDQILVNLAASAFDSERQKRVLDPLRSLWLVVLGSVSKTAVKHKVYIPVLVYCFMRSRSCTPLLKLCTSDRGRNPYLP